MKVAILAGGLGTRMREETEFKPKPMVEIGGRPVIWHIMKQFAHHGHKEFVVLTGYKGAQFRDYFYQYLLHSLDFTVRLGDPGSIRFHGKQSEADWVVSVVDTGVASPTGARLHLARSHLQGETFLCAYGDSLANVNITELVDFHEQHPGAASLTRASPANRFGVVETDSRNRVTAFKEKPQDTASVSIGFFVFDPPVFDLLSEDSVLEKEPLERLTRDGSLFSFTHQGFWQPMDTYREYRALNELWDSGVAPWADWRE